MILESDLLRHPGELARILIHEVFHFAWVRLGNTRRNKYAALLKDEWGHGARGELGWSADYRKHALVQEYGRDPGVSGHPKWREYVCESFCDTAAWRYLQVAQHDEFTLRHRYRSARERCFAELFDDAPIRV